MLSHVHNRVFQPHQLTAPRDFSSEDWRWITQTSNVLTNHTSHLSQHNDKDYTKHELVLEIGAGKGKHAIDYATNHPKQKVIAIERTKGKFEAFAKSFSKSVALLKTSDSKEKDKKYEKDNRQATDNKSVMAKSLDNLYPVHADAIAWTVFALPPRCLHGVYLLYPNPEPSNPNQQWLNMPFFEFLLSRLRDNGQIIVASNIADYIDNAYQKAVHVWQLPTQLQQVPSSSQRTHFEIKYLARGECCQQLLITKPMGYKTRFDELMPLGVAS